MYDSKEFYKSVLKILIKDDNFTDHIQDIDESFFRSDLESLGWFKKIKLFIKKYNRINHKIFQEEYPESKELIEFPDGEWEDYARQNIKEFIYSIRMKSFVDYVQKEYSTKGYKDIDFSQLKDRVNKLQVAWIDDSDGGELEFFADGVVESLMLERLYHHGVPTGLKGIDDRLDGHGLCDSQFGIIMGKVGTGKSWFLINFALEALNAGRNVLLASTEMTKEQLAFRLLMALCRMTKDELIENFNEVVEKHKQWRDKLKGRVWFKQYESNTATVKDIEQYMIGLKKRHNYETNFLVVDYADPLICRGTYGRDDLKWKEIYDDLAGLAKRYNMPVWSASQGKLGDEVLGMASFSDAKNKANIADIILAINKNEVEILKNRHDFCGYREHVNKLFSIGRVVDDEARDTFYAKEFGHLLNQTVESDEEEKPKTKTKYTKKKTAEDWLKEEE